MPKNFSPKTGFSRHKSKHWLSRIKKQFPNAGNYLPNKRKRFPNGMFHQDVQPTAELFSQWTVFSSLRHFPMGPENFPRTCYFPNGMFQLPNDISRSPNVSTSEGYSCLWFLPFVLIQEYPFPVFKNRRKQKTQTSATANRSAEAFPFTCPVNLRKEK